MSGQNPVDEALARSKQAGIKGNYKVAIKAADEVLAQTQMHSKEHTRALGYKGYATAKLKQWSEALSILEQAEKSHLQSKALDPRTKRESQAVRGALEECLARLNMPPPLIKFPRTAHLFDLGASTVDDVILPDATAFQGRLVSIEEKIDGANLGITKCPVTGRLWVQNRSHYITAGDHAQFGPLTAWIEEHREALVSILSHDNRLILFGEWMVAKHSIPYHRLPGYFIAFDLFDTKLQRFYSRPRFHQALRKSGIPVAPTLVPSASFDSLRSSLRGFLDKRSAFRADEGHVEGIVVRMDKADWLESRSKLVRSDFISGCQDGHWMRKPICKQIIDFAFSETYLESCYVFEQGPVKKQQLNDDSTQVSSGQSSEKPPGRMNISRELQRKRRRVPRCVMLMGLPGSGKSTFANALASSAGTNASEQWLVLNQDRLGRKECLRLASKASRRTRVIIDRCHLTQKDRAEWVDVVHSPPPGEIALVCFRASADVCATRVQQRENHETIPVGCGAKLVHRLASRMEPLTDKENKMFGIVKYVETFKDSILLLEEWGVTFEEGT